MIYITSDWHFMHNRDFLYEPRGFSNPRDMSEEIVRKHNEIVTDEDDVYHLGDEILSDTEKGIEYIKHLKGRIHLIRGNHSTDNKIQQIVENCPNVVEVIGWAAILKYKKYHFYLSHYPTKCSNYDDGESLKTKVINLCGHTHTNDPFYDWEYGTIFHVEMETNNCYPWLIDDIIERMKEKING